MLASIDAAMKPFKQRLDRCTRETLDPASVVDGTRLTETDAVELARAIARG
jgi:hypothetical protein